jgi:spore coat polysaccharide biosynthesis protein SpsF (cytidylyltransferase family)
MTIGFKEEYASPFADFIRNAKSQEKKRVYREVLTAAIKKQNEVMLVARNKHSAVGAVSMRRLSAVMTSGDFSRCDQIQELL